ncbi:hypothetical protein [Antribacter gilvus]|uniref:hypothetical protein n=1 Tax=Antribacter gilvus TaxID=2304675 RepID=UPI000F776CB5|nr:hypothetical protein [Antribacter gilvus]
MSERDDWYERESGQMPPHEIRQRLMAEYRPGDNDPVSIQRRRLEKVLLILDLFAFDHVGSASDARTAIRYLRTESMEQKYEPGVMMPTAAELGRLVDALEWPTKLGPEESVTHAGR